MLTITTIIYFQNILINKVDLKGAMVLVYLHIIAGMMTLLKSVILFNFELQQVMKQLVII